MPAPWHSWTLRGTCERGGSKMPHSVKKQSFEEPKSACKRSSALPAPARLRRWSISPLSKGQMATRRLRRALAARSEFFCFTTPRSSSDISAPAAWSSPSAEAASTALRCGRIRSGAPLSTAKCEVPAGKRIPAARPSEGSAWMVAIIFRPEVKGTSRSSCLSRFACKSAASSSHNPPLAAATLIAASVMFPVVNHSSLSSARASFVP
mmetsp:Transcript_81076/g.235147  ORF Transcript_81076/g.235147 Transcript_81076/m.235147 type:complete len:208 (+) Transcript_81076:653-1276(+)